ncbi:unnamed protein product [Heligmosomoides polygyrus]|uniref:Ground-like domain-containing protein n=1 Tax=Heligmosomoides polygyrus TaxID=6339 RepID=A0A183G301_HELPZ|nr:unnamed protein product [Heligmosomoides polygyrus]
MRCTVVVIVFASSAVGFLFPTSGSGCGCVPCAPQPICQPLPTCPPVQSCPAPAPVCCDTCACKTKQRKKRSIEQLAENVYVLDFDERSGNLTVDGLRPKRDALDEVVKNVDRITSVSKRRIQSECEGRLQGRYNVICARGDFSYITNTEEFCQQTIGDVTCYVFKQLSDVIRARLS